MAINQETFNTKLYELLKVRGYNPIPKDVKNQRTTPKKADVFNFTFKKEGKEYGNSWVTIDDANNVIVYYDQEQYDSPDGKTPGLDYDDSWTGFLKHLKRWSMNKQLSFELAPKDRLGDDMARREETKQDALNEGYYPINKTASYSDAVPSVKIILQHTRQIQEGEQRFRNISKIFLENEVGERILAPTTRPGIARVYARHLAEGGLPHDDRWNHISGLVEEYTKMAGFVRATRGNTFNESATKLVEAGMNHYLSLRETLGKLTGHRGYNTYFESYTPPLMEDDTDATTINELFVQETLDPRIESVMPILNKLQKQISEMSEMKELEEWADNLINEKMDNTTAMAVPADKMLDEAPGAETLAHNQNTEKSNLKAFDLDEEDKSGKADLDDLEKRIEKLFKKQQQKAEPKAAEIPDMDQGTKAQEISNLAKKKKEKVKSKLGIVDEEMTDAEKAEIKIKTPAFMRKDKVTTQDLEKAKEKNISSKEGLSALQKRLDQIDKEGVAEGSLNEGQYEMMLRNGQVKKFVAKDDADAKRIAAGHGAKSVIKLKGGVPAGKIAGQGVAEDTNELGYHTRVRRGDFRPSKYGEDEYNYLHDLMNTSGDGSGPMLVTIDDKKIARQIAAMYGGDVEETGLGTYRIVQRRGNSPMENEMPKLTGVAEGLGSTTNEYGVDFNAIKRGDIVYISDSDSSTRKGYKVLGRAKFPNGSLAVKIIDKSHPDGFSMADFLEIEKVKKKQQGVAEDLDANQKRVGQLGPTEKVKNNNIGKLVGANESVEHDPLDELKRLLGK